MIETGARTTVTLGRAGHPPPLLRRRGGTVEPVGGTGTLLGVFDDPELELGTAVMEPGDMLVLYTDGVTDAWRDAGGEQRLADMLASLPDETTAEQVVEQTKRAALGQGSRGSDDIAVLVLRMPPAVG